MYDSECVISLFAWRCKMQGTHLNYTVTDSNDVQECTFGI